MLLTKKKTKPIGIGSLVRIGVKAGYLQKDKKMFMINSSIFSVNYIVIGSIKSCDQKIVRLLQVSSNSTQINNYLSTFAKGNRLIFVAYDLLVESDYSYQSLFGENKQEAINNLMNDYAISFVRQ
jgi:hypothetical protein